MVGLFDSGGGGLNTVRYIRKNAPWIDLVYRIDRINAPYGIKTHKEIIDITQKNIKELIERGAEKVLIACCTASSVHEDIDEEYRSISIPIISPIAKEALKATENGKIAVIATERTVKSHIFRSILGECLAGEFSTQDIVAMVDNGINDCTISERRFEQLKNMLSCLNNTDADTLVLGCTHFPSLINSIGEIVNSFGIKHIIDSAKIGARTLIKYEIDN